MSDAPDPLACAHAAQQEPGDPTVAPELDHRTLRQRVHAWSWLLGRFVGVQMFVQVIGFFSGILLVRNLTKADYAFFTIANTMLGTMNLLADSGIGSGLTSIGGRVWDQPVQLGLLIRTALHLRRTLGLAVLAVVVPILSLLLHRNGAPIPLIATIDFFVLASLYLQLNNGVLSVIPRLLLQTGRLQQMDFVCAVLRLAIIFAAVKFYINTPVALFAAAVAFLVQWLMLRRWVTESTAPASAPDSAMQGEMVSIIKRQGPNTLYYCLQGQITVWLISVFGNRNSVADIGALGRLAVIFTIIGSVMGSIVIPRYARLQVPGLLLRRYWQIVAIYAAIVISLTGAAAIFPKLFLSVLGGKYMGLQHELILLVALNGLTAIVGGIWSINASKGWIAPTWLHVGVPFAFQLLCLRFVDLSTVAGVIYLAAASMLPEFFITLSYAMFNIRHVAKTSPQT